MGDLSEFVVDVLRFQLQRKKFSSGTSLLCLGMEVWFSCDGIRFAISEALPEIRRDPPEVPRLNQLLHPQASQLAGRLNWACNTLFGRCGRAFLSPILARSTHREARPEAQPGPCHRPYVVEALALGATRKPHPVCPGGSPPVEQPCRDILQRQHVLRPWRSVFAARLP